MPQQSNRTKIVESLKSLTDTYVQAMNQLQQTIVILEKELGLTDVSAFDEAARLNRFHRRKTALPRANRATLSAEYSGQSCFLGNTLLFWLFEKLSRSPNRYFSHNELLDDIWRGPRAKSSIRHAVKRLRDKLPALWTGKAG